MKRERYLLMLLTSCALFACGSPEQGAGDAEEEVDRETVFDPLVNTLDEAAQVEDQVMEQKQQMDDALRRMEGEEDETDP